MTEKLNLAIIFGGQSGEHEVSLASVRSVINSLNKEKYNIIPIAITKKGNWLIGDKGEKYRKLHDEFAGKENAVSLESSQSLVSVSDDEKNLANYIEGDIGAKKIDLAFPILHGPYGEDGKLQGMLDMLNIPYVFSDCLANAIAMNKEKANIIAKNAGVLTADNIVLRKKLAYNINEIINKLSLPVVIKPVELGSSVGISIPDNKKDLEEGIIEAFRYGDKVLVEKHIKGRELTVTIMGSSDNPEALPVIEIIPKISKWFDYKAKYEKDGSEEICPADIPEKIKEKVQKLAKKVYVAIGCKDLARADFIWEEKTDNLYFIDLNTIPGMTATSLAPQAAKAAGMEFSKFLDKLIGYNIKK
jgi:D-alanine-D-alanine ligase